MQDKYLKRAISTIGIVFGDEEPQNEKDLDRIISDSRRLVSDAELKLEELKEAVEVLRHQIELAQAVKRQIKVERYKDLNPGYEIF